ncbi:MAG: PAS domain-containing protein [Dehalococcoidia bacterium]
METQKADGPPGLLLGNADSQMPAGLSRLAAVFENLHAVLEHSLAVVIVTDANGVIEYVNPRFAEVTGYTTAEAIGHHVTTISRDPAADEAAWLALDRGEPWRGEIRYERPDGGQYCALASIHPLRSSSGEITRYIGIHVDISEQKSTEAALQKREAYWRALGESAPPPPPTTSSSSTERGRSSG